MNEGGLRWNLCDPERVVNGHRFTCASKADSATTWACTGSEHLPVGRNAVEVVCTCSCHVTVESPLTPREVKRFVKLSRREDIFS